MADEYEAEEGNRRGSGVALTALMVARLRKAGRELSFLTKSLQQPPSSAPTYYSSYISWKTLVLLAGRLTLERWPSQLLRSSSMS